MTTLLDYIDKAERERQSGLPCRLCGSSDALSIDAGTGDTGVAHCFSCQWGGTGAQYVVAAFDSPLSDILAEMGARDSLDYAAGTPRERAARQRVAESRAHDLERRRHAERAVHVSQAPGRGFTLLQINRIRSQMTDEEHAEMDTAHKRLKASGYAQKEADRVTTMWAKMEARVLARFHEIDHADSHADDIKTGFSSTAKTAA